MPHLDAEDKMLQMLADAVARRQRQKEELAMFRRDQEEMQQVMDGLMAILPVELRLRRLTPEQRLSGLSPEERLRGLTPADREYLRLLLQQPPSQEGEESSAKEATQQSAMGDHSPRAGKTGEQIEEFHQPGRRFAMSDDEMFQGLGDVFAGLPLAEQLASFSHEERLRGLTPEERLRGLNPEERERLRLLLQQPPSQEGEKPDPK